MTKSQAYLIIANELLKDNPFCRWGLLMRLMGNYLRGNK